MSARHRYALAACNTGDLFDLAKLLTGAVQDAIAEGQMPPHDPAVRLICHQIAFAGNGDLSFHPLYQASWNFCNTKVNEGPNAAFPTGIITPVPVYEPS